MRPFRWEFNCAGRGSFEEECGLHTFVPFGHVGMGGGVLKKYLQSEVYVLSVKDIVLAGEPVPVRNGYA
jgi:hypothetical protein